MNATELCRHNETAIKHAMGEKGQSRIAEIVGVSEATISRFKSNDVAHVAAVLAAAGLTVVPEDWPTVDPEHLRAITILAREALKDTGWKMS